MEGTYTHSQAFPQGLLRVPTLSMVVALPSPPTQVYLRGDSGGLHLHLPPPRLSWGELWQQLSVQLQGHPQLPWGKGLLTLWAGGWVLGQQQLQAIASLAASRSLGLYRVQTTCRQTAIAAVELGYSVEQTPPLTPSAPSGDYANPLYLKTTVRSGTAIRHPGTVVIEGDVNPGGEIIAGGDIVVWGRLRGVAHAGSDGYQQATISSLYLAPTQLRIADRVARSPDSSLEFPTPEVAYLDNRNVICIASVSEFLRRAV